MASSLVSELERMSNALEKQELTLADIPLPAIADRVAKHVGVNTDEVGGSGGVASFVD
jgi:hypothetical protein